MFELEELDRFNAASESGKTHVIRRVQKIQRTRTEAGNEVVRIHGQPYYITESGGAVVTDDLHAFKIVDTDEIVWQVW